MTLRIKHILLICVVIIITGHFHACRRGEIYHSFREIKNLEWTKADTLIFHVDSTKIVSGIPYDISIEVASNADYPYRNLWFFVYDNVEDSTFRYYPRQYILADEFGKWYGSGFGALYQMSLEYKKGIVFREKRDYIFKIVHGMRDEPLKGIEKVGLKIKKSN